MWQFMTLLINFILIFILNVPNPIIPQIKPIINPPHKNTIQRNIKPYQAAEQYMGYDAQSHTKQLEQLFHNELGVYENPKHTAWCALFVNSILHKSGYKTADNVFLARSFLSYSTETKNPQIGDLIVFKDLTGKNPWGGHVGFFMGFDVDKVKSLGGNQYDSNIKAYSVIIKEYPKKMVISYRQIMTK